MSLVNDMLKALEEREALPHMEADAEDFYVDLEPSHSVSGHYKKLYFGLSFLGFVIAVGSVYIFLSNEAPPGSVPVFAEKPPQAPSQYLAQVSAPVIKDAEEFTTEAQSQSPLTVIDINKELNVRINALLREAEVAMLNNRLTDPVQDNAYSRYQSVLLLEPANSEALTGIQNIAARYIEFAHKTNNRGATKLAGLYWDKAQRIARQHPDLAEWLALQEAPSINTQATTPLSAQVSSQLAPQQEAPQVDSVADNSALNVKPSRQFLDQQISDQANELIGRQQLTEAEVLLTTAINANPTYQLSRQLLFNLYLQQNNISAGEQLLAQWPNLIATQRSLLQARLAVQQQQWQDAEKVLITNLSLAAEDEEYIALLAAVHHQLGHYQNAVDRYQQLLSLNKRNSTYWLGLAVSCDALADGSGALKAFKFARLYGGLDQNTFAYVEERIQTLTLALGAG